MADPHAHLRAAYERAKAELDEQRAERKLYLESLLSDPDVAPAARRVLRMLYP